MIEIVTATKEDIDAIVLMEEEMFSDHMSSSTLTNSVGTDLFLVLKEANVITGYFLGHCLMDDMEIYRIAVLPDKQQMGYGKKLLNEAMRQAKQQGAKQCFLEVRESNAVARRLYNSFGFQEIDRRRRFYRMPDEDGIVMMIRLE